MTSGSEPSASGGTEPSSPAFDGGDGADGTATNATRDAAPLGNGDAASLPDVQVPPGDPAVQLVGRFDTRDAAGPRCGWPGCRILARFEGTQVGVRFNEIDDSWMVGAPSEWDVIIDGVLQPKLVLQPGAYQYALATSLPAGAHTVELYKRSESQNGTTQLLGLELGGGTLLPPPPRLQRRIEVIGDSAAAGFGIEGIGLGPDCPGADHGALYQNFHKSFGARMGALVNAEVAGSVYSGKGIAKNIWHPDSETMPIIWNRALAIDPTSTWDFSFVPHAVVIMMGGNDFAVGQPVDTGPATPEEFAVAYEAFVANIRVKYPVAHILLVVSPSTSDTAPAGRNTRTNVLAGVQTVAYARNAQGDLNVGWLAPAPATPDELTACNGHGTPAFHDRVAVAILNVLKPKLGW